MTKNNPFPGMNPFLERHWSDVHTKLVAFIAEALAENLPDDLSARAEEHVTLHYGDGEERPMRPDVAVVESWKQGIPPQWQPESAQAGGTAIAEPQIIIVEEITERWVEIRDKNGNLITVIEVLSPSNKGNDRSFYQARRDAYIQGSVNLVEIDLLRGGTHTVAVLYQAVRKPAGAFYLACVSRAATAGLREVYDMPLRQALKTIRIPLRPEEPDAILALQPLIDRCYRMGSYWNEDHTNLPGPPLNPDDAAWVAAQVQAAGLSG
jgi:Protein of unknown function (DUF4058)